MSLRKPLRTCRGGGWDEVGRGRLRRPRPAPMSTCCLLPGRRKRPHSTQLRSRPYGYDPFFSPNTYPCKRLSPRQKLCSRKKGREKALGKEKIVQSEREKTLSGGRSWMHPTYYSNTGADKSRNCFPTCIATNRKPSPCVCKALSSQERR